MSTIAENPHVEPTDGLSSFLRKLQTRSHTRLVVQILLESLGFSANNTLQVLRVSRGALIQTKGLHLFKLSRILHHPIRKTTLLDGSRVFVKTQLNVLDFLTGSFRQELGHVGIASRTGTRQVVRFVAVGLNKKSVSNKLSRPATNQTTFNLPWGSTKPPQPHPPHRWERRS